MYNSTSCNISAKLKDIKKYVNINNIDIFIFGKT